MFAVFAAGEGVGFVVGIDGFIDQTNGASGPGDDVAQVREGGGEVPIFDFDLGFKA